MNGEGYKLIHACSLLSDEKEIKFRHQLSDWFWYKVDNQNIRIGYITIHFRCLHAIDAVEVKGINEGGFEIYKCWQSEQETPLAIKSLAWELLREFYRRGVLNEY